MSKIGFSSNPSNGASHTWRNRRRFNYSSSKGGWQAKGATPPTPTAPTLNASTDLQDMNDATGLAARMRGMAVMYNSYSDFPTEDIYTGTFAYARDTNELYVWTGASPAPASFYGDRAVYFGGRTTVNLDIVDYASISTGGTAQVAGFTLGSILAGAAGFSNGTRGVIAGGNSSSFQTAIQYTNISTLAGMSAFGDLTTARFVATAVTDATYGVIGGGAQTGTSNRLSSIEYVTTETESNTSSFGNLTRGRYNMAGISHATRGIFAGGSYNNTGSGADGAEFFPLNEIDYITIATPSSATDFGDITSARARSAGAEDNTHGVVAMGYDRIANISYQTVDKITIDTLGSATDFGNAGFDYFYMQGTSDGSLANFTGGSSGDRAHILKMTIATSATCTDYGDLSTGRYILAAAAGNAS